MIASAGFSELRAFNVFKVSKRDMDKNGSLHEKPNIPITTDGNIEHQEGQESIKMDKHGLPLTPQPSENPMDPLNWKPWLKYLVLGQVSLLSFTALLSASLIVSVLICLG